MLENNIHLKNLLERFRFESNWFQATWFILFLLIQFVKAPQVFIEGRFWAEEGAFFWANALDRGPFENLGFVVPIADYLNLIASILSSLASLVPIEVAPLVTTIGALIVMYLPIFTFMRLCPTEMPWQIKLGILLGLTFTPGINIGEVFANSINSQTHLGLAVGIAAIFIDRWRQRQWWLAPVFFVSTLSGPYAVAMAPAIIYGAIRFRKLKLPALSLGAFTFGASIQIFTIVSALISRSSFETRILIAQDSDLGQRLFQVGWQILGLTFIGDSTVSTLSKTFGVFTAALVLLVCLMALVGHKKIVSSNTWLRNEILRRIEIALIGFLFVEVMVLVAGYPNGRYIVVPAGLLIILLQFLIFLATDKPFLRAVLFASVLLVTFLGLILQLTSTTSGSSYRCESCTSWRDQVSEVKAGVRDYFVHWPSPPYEPSQWMTNAKDPKVRLAPHQLIFLDLSNSR